MFGKGPGSPHWSLPPSPHCQHSSRAWCGIKRARSCWSCKSPAPTTGRPAGGLVCRREWELANHLSLHRRKRARCRFDRLPL